MGTTQTPPAPGGASPTNISAPAHPPGSPFLPHRLLRGGHVQTIASFLLQRHIELPAAEERLIEVAPGIQVRTWCHWISPQPSQRQSALTMIVVHGLEGSTESQYMHGMARSGLAAGINVVLMNQRNCGGTDHFAPTLYNSSLSADVGAVAKHFVAVDGVSRFALAGFSMGGNLVLKLAGEWGSDGPAQFRAVGAVCPAIDLAASVDALHEPANRIYEYYFLMQLFRRLRRKAQLFPSHFDPARLRGVRTLRGFDDRITAHYCGFAGASDYYARATAAHVLHRIAVPTLIIHAANDPFVRLQPETRRKILANPNITYLETKDGGHCAFIGEPNREKNGDRNKNKNKNKEDDGRWAEEEIVKFLTHTSA